MIGVFCGYNSDDDLGLSVIDRVIDKVLGFGFVLVLVGSFVKNFVFGFCLNEVKNDFEEIFLWVRLLCDDKCREFLVDCIERFISIVVFVYFDKMMDINIYD